MLYPLYVHHEEGSAWGGEFPDIPGCFTAADDLADLPRMAQEAVEAHFHGEALSIPEPSSIEQWVNDASYTNGVWMLVEIDLAKVNTKPIRLNISLPANLVQRIDRAAEAAHMSRSGFLAKAAQQAMAS